MRWSLAIPGWPLVELGVAMPFRGDKYQGAYTPQDLEILNQALHQCYDLFAPGDVTETLRNALAKNILTAFDQGEMDPHIIAGLAARMQRSHH